MSLLVFMLVTPLAAGDDGLLGGRGRGVFFGLLDVGHFRGLFERGGIGSSELGVGLMERLRLEGEGEKFYIVRGKVSIPVSDKAEGRG